MAGKSYGYVQLTKLVSTQSDNDYLRMPRVRHDTDYRCKTVPIWSITSYRQIMASVLPLYVPNS